MAPQEQRQVNIYALLSSQDVIIMCKGETKGIL